MAAVVSMVFIATEPISVVRDCVAPTQAIPVLDPTVILIALSHAMKPLIPVRWPIPMVAPAMTVQPVRPLTHALEGSAVEPQFPAMMETPVP